jgi:hypothetical protein
MHTYNTDGCAYWLQIYKPDQPNGKRFTKTGAKTKIARLYHATSILTKDGDILIVSGSCQSI